MKNVSALLLACLLAVSAHAGQEHSQHHKHDKKHEHRQHDAHVHGLAILNLVHDGDAVMLELQTPVMNVLGFEHKPQNLEQEQQLEKAIQILSDADNIARLAGSDCLVQDIQLDMPELAKGHGHADIEVRLHYTCTGRAGAVTLDVQLFRHFSGFENIRLQWIVQGSQGSTVLTADRHSVKTGLD